jgi:hypothetical protein
MPTKKRDIKKVGKDKNKKEARQSKSGRNK